MLWCYIAEYQFHVPGKLSQWNGIQKKKNHWQRSKHAWHFHGAKTLDWKQNVWSCTRFITTYKHTFQRFIDIAMVTWTSQTTFHTKKDWEKNQSAYKPDLELRQFDLVQVNSFEMFLFINLLFVQMIVCVYKGLISLITNTAILAAAIGPLNIKSKIERRKTRIIDAYKWFNNCRFFWYASKQLMSMHSPRK